MMKRIVTTMLILLSVGTVLLTGSGIASAAGTGWYRQTGCWRYRLENGVDATGWFKSGGSWYYLKSNGNMATGWQKFSSSGSSQWYYMDGSGVMRTGWVYAGSRWYYMSESGAMAIGWQRIKGIWHYFKPSGAMACKEWVGDYYLQSDGSMATNCWIGKYYVGADGRWIPNSSGGNGSGTVTSSPSDGVYGTPPEEAEQPIYEEKMVYHEGLSRKVFDNINVERVKVGLAPYKWQDKRCGKMARLQSGYNVLRYDPATMVIGNLPFNLHHTQEIGYFTNRTPIAAAERVVESWMGSPIHKSSILSKHDELCAVAVYSYQNSEGEQWVSIIAAMVKADIDMQYNDTIVPPEYWDQILNCEIE